MKVIRFFALAIAAIVSGISCTVAEDPEIINQAFLFPVFEASIEDSCTKVYADDNLKVLWHREDRVSIFNKNTYNSQYKFDGETGDNSGTFSAVPDNDYVAGNALDYVYALYPYSQNAVISNAGVLSVELPATQSYAECSFGKESNTMVALTADNLLHFKNVCGYLMFKLYGEGLYVSSIRLKAKGGESLAGLASLNISSEGEPSAEITSNGSDEVVLKCDIPVALGASADSYKEFWFAIPPIKLSQGFTVLVTLGDGRTFEKSYNSPVTITRSHRTRMAPIEVVPTGEPMAIPVAVDLGLSVKWATFNVGATKPEEYGDYFAWGETESKSDYSWNNYKWWNGNDGVFERYNYDESYGIIDNKQLLELEDDAARANWGGYWRMPTINELKELYANCTMIPETINGVKGIRFFSNIEGYTNASVFFPYSGFHSATNSSDINECGNYWSSSIAEGYLSVRARFSYVGDEQQYNHCNYVANRCLGISVRPVTNEGNTVSVTSISLDNNNVILTEGETITLSATVLPEDATQQTVIWTSSNQGAVSVSYDGVVTAIYEGTSTITATSYDGKYTATCNVTVQAKNHVPIPDAAFKSFLVEYFDHNGNGEISTGEAEWATWMSFSTENIYSLSGIEYFVNLESIACYGDYVDGQSTGKLTSLDLSHNTKLNYIYCENNNLNDLVIGNNTSLTSLYCYNNQLASLKLPASTTLATVSCYSNQLTSLDLSSNTALSYLSCVNNQLGSLDLSTNTALKYLFCYNNQLTSLKLPATTSLTTISCYNNQLTSLDTSGNPALTNLYCEYNQISSLNLYNNTELKFFDAGANKLSSLDISNCPNLIECFCGYMNLNEINLSNNSVLEKLHCPYNQIDALDVSKNKSLWFLDCGGNKMTSLDLSANTALETLYTGSCLLVELNIDNASSLRYCDCGSNKIQSLNLASNTALEELHCGSNLLTVLDVSSNLALRVLHCGSNPYLKKLWLMKDQTINDFEYDSNVTTIYYKEQNAKMASLYLTPKPIAGHFTKRHESDLDPHVIDISLSQIEHKQAITQTIGGGGCDSNCVKQQEASDSKVPLSKSPCTKDIQPLL